MAPSLRIVTANIPLHPEGGAATTPRSAETTTPPARVNPFADAIALSAQMEAERSRIEIVADYTDDFARVMVEARAVHGPGRLGLLKWLDVRGQMMRPALHPLDPRWVAAFDDYYASRRLIMLARKGLRAGGSSSACPALTRCALFADRALDAGTIGAIPIMSATRDEADGRFVTIRSYLRAAGLTPPRKGKRGGDDDFGGYEPDEDGISYVVPAGGIEGTFQSKRSASGGGIIAIQDRHKHRIQFRILPALVKHGVGYTGVAGFLDETDLWPNDPEHHVNPAELILDRVSERFTTAYNDEALRDPTIDPGAEMLLFSASYYADSAHKRAVDEALKGGDSAALTHLVRLSEEGARLDTIARRAFAEETGNTDPRLWAPGDPMSPDLPAWVYNPTETVRKCYGFSKGDVSRMLAKYGGRAAENVAISAAGPFAAVEFVAGDPPVCVDTVTGIAPDGAAWVAVTVGIEPNGVLYVLACYGWLLPLARPSSVIAVHAAHEPRARAEIAAFIAGAYVHVPPVAPTSIYDGATLRTSPLATLYARGRVRHASGLAALEDALRSHTDEKPSPIVEALVAAVSRLVACYPWLGAGGEPEAMRGPRAAEGMHEGGERPEALTRRLGAR